MELCGKLVRPGQRWICNKPKGHKGGCVSDESKPNFEIPEDPKEPTPGARTFDEFVEDLEKINYTNLRDNNFMVLTCVQWQELKEIVDRGESSK